MKLTLHESDRCYRLTFSFRVDKVNDERYSVCLPKAESPAELAIILRHEAELLNQKIMRHIKHRCGRDDPDTVDAIAQPEDDAPVWDDD